MIKCQRPSLYILCSVGSNEHSDTGGMVAERAMVLRQLKATP